MEFDFKSYHIRAINASDEAEKKAINQELKDFYASLGEEEKKVFNAELQRYLLQEVGRLGSDYEAIKNSNA
ncbi:hypothetical protein [Aquirufa rosea]|uniref:Uncharacterized protein n=1 Tax=Aquirufa rosea TaxID=2509241 RepID=A0A4V1M5I8_9BACT|nr:hypothetical protein [Aquirufa rosea]RXK49864.1 hypothetical protein ESB04_06740 [Aquirufa rosea]